MVNVYKTNNQILETIERDTYIKEGYDFEGCWVELTNPTDKEIEFISKATNVEEEHIKAPLDEEERARIEKDENLLITIVDIPIIEEEEDYYSYSTLPMGIIINDKTVLTVCLKETIITRDFFTGRIKNFKTYKKNRFLLQLLYNIATKYLHYLKLIDKASQKIQNVLHKSTRNKELIQLLDLENSLVYLSTSLRGNDLVISKLINTPVIRKFEEDEELLEDVAIENKQALEMCNIYRDILSGTMDAYASVISNNQNSVMKVLTQVTILLSIPTIIASFWGMNVKVPGEGSILGFWLVVAFSIIISIVVGVGLFKSKFKG
ncbi:MAG: magnesium transporter CorA family protein [Clostridia bacterium]